jgi:ubiquinone biosynthesis protein COQ4
MVNPEEYGKALHRLREGLDLGWKAKHLLAQKWELAWEGPLNQWQEELRITPAA